MSDINYTEKDFENYIVKLLTTKSGYIHGNNSDKKNFFLVYFDNFLYYFYIDLFRKKIKPFLSKIYYNNLYLCDNERTTAIIAWIMENI